MRAKVTATDETFGNKVILGNGIESTKKTLVSTKAGVEKPREEQPRKGKGGKSMKSVTTRSRTRRGAPSIESENEDSQNSSVDGMNQNYGSDEADNEQTMVYQKKDMSMANMGRGRMSRTAKKGGRGADDEAMSAGEMSEDENAGNYKNKGTKVLKKHVDYIGEARRAQL